MDTVQSTAAADLSRAITAACNFLVDRQGSDGSWQDYTLAPGRSDSWMTACVGVALHTAMQAGVPDVGHARAVDRAVAALLSSRRRAGWGYNKNVACDADSTSWAVRFLTMRDRDSVSSEVFDRYLTSIGGVRTFAMHRKFGSWADEHDEVAPMAGLALQGLGDSARVARIRSRVLARHRDHGVWLKFWWQSNAYATATSLTFLSRTGGIPASVFAAERKRLDDFLDRTSLDRESPFDIVHRLVCAVRLDASDAVPPLCRCLLAAQLSDGGWTASGRLVLPNRWDVASTEIFADDRRLFSTAMSVMALAEVPGAAPTAPGQSASRLPSGCRTHASEEL